MWECKKCGACCTYIGCKFCINNECSIYNSRPELCRVRTYDKIYNENMLNKACEVLRNKLKEKGE